MQIAATIKIKMPNLSNAKSFLCACCVWHSQNPIANDISHFCWVIKIHVITVNGNNNNKQPCSTKGFSNANGWPERKRKWHVQSFSIFYELIWFRMHCFLHIIFISWSELILSEPWSLLCSKYPASVTFDGYGHGNPRLEHCTICA